MTIQIADPTIFDDQEVAQAAAQWDRDLNRRALDELFILAKQYRSTATYVDLLSFITRFRDYSPFNAMLVRTQMHGACFVAPASRWLRDYGRRVKAGARPLVILQPMGPVMFVFDVSDTVPEPDAPPLPREVEKPFELRGGRVTSEFQATCANAIRDGIQVATYKVGSQAAGRISTVTTKRTLSFPRKLQPTPEYLSVPHRYDLLLAEGHTDERNYATLVHELAHLYCGHLGTYDTRLWPDRRFLSKEVEEFEAESVSYLVCRRLGLDTGSEDYLSGYVGANAETPSISLECVLKAAGLIEQMGRGRMQPRPEKKNQ